MGQGRRKITSARTIVVERSGGVAGTRLRATLSESDLSPADAARLRELIAALEPPAAPGLESQPSGADRFNYEVAVTTGTDKRRMAGADGALAPGWRAIVSFVMAHGKRGHQPPDK